MFKKSYSPADPLLRSGCHGDKYRILLWLPDYKSVVAPSRLAPACLGNIEHTYSWRFIANDKRAVARGSWRRVKGSNEDLIYLTCENHGWSGMPVQSKSPGKLTKEEWPAAACPPEELEATPPVLQEDSQEWKGWRTSILQT